MSVTYRGGAESRQRTVDLVTGMLRTTNLVPMAHLICVAHTRLELAEILVELRKAGVENLMALGGDPPTDPDAGVGELAFASELVELARAIGGFSIGVAAQPGGHPLSADLAADRDHLAAKLALADFGVTQFFFEAHEYTVAGGRPGRAGGDQAGAARHHAGRPTSARCPGWRPWARPCPAGWSSAWRRPTRRGGAEAVRHEGVACATELCEELMARRGPGPALLHAQPVERDPRDLLRPGPRPELSGPARPGPVRPPLPGRH